MVPGFRHGVAGHRLGRKLIKCRFKQCHQRHGRHPPGEKLDSVDVGRVVGGRQAIVRRHRAEHTLVEPHTAGHVFGNNCLEADRRKITFAGDDAGVAQLAKTIVNRLRIIQHALEAAFVQQAFAAVRAIEQPPLERSRTDVGDEDFHVKNPEIRGPKSERNPKLEIRTTVSQAWLDSRCESISGFGLRASFGFRGFGIWIFPIAAISPARRVLRADAG